MVDSFQSDSFTPDSFTPEVPAKDSYIQGFFKTYKKGEDTNLLRKADVLVGKTTTAALDTINAPFEAVGEAIAAPLEGRKAIRPTILGGEGEKANPFSMVNKLLRAGAGAVSGIPGGTPLESARAAYHAPRGAMGTAEDTAMALLMGKIAPDVAAAPVDAMTMGAQKVISGTKKIASTVAKRSIRTALGPTEKAQSVLFNRPQDVARQTTFQGLGDKLADTTSGLSIRLTELDNKAWDTLPVNEMIPKAKITSILNEVKKEFTGKGGTKIGTADQQAVKQIDGYIKRVNEVTQEAPLASGTGLKTAIKIRGKTYIGNPGEIHVDVVNRVAKELGTTSSQLYDDISKIGDLGFSKGGKFLSRDEASKMLAGVKPEAASMLAAGKMASMPKTDLAKVDISHPQLKDIIQSIQKDARYDLPESDPANRAVQAVRARIDTYLKKINPAYGDAMVPVADATAALKDTVKRFRLERTPEGYVPTKVTIDRLKALSEDKSPELTRAIADVKKVTGIDFADEAKLTAVKEQFTPGIQRTAGSRRVVAGGAAGAGIGTALSHTLGLPAPVGATLGSMGGAGVGAAADYYGGAMAKNIIDMLSKGRTGVGNVLAAVNAKSQGTPIQAIIQRLLQGQPALAPLLKNGQ